MSPGPEVRRIAEGDTIPVAVLRDFLLWALRHDAIHDVLIERMSFFADCGQLDPEGLAILLPELIGEVLDIVGKEDWIAIAELLIEDFDDARAEGGAR